MKTVLLQVGKTVNKHFVTIIDDYVGRIGHYMPFEIVTIPELKNTKGLSEAQQKQAEGELILRQLQPSDTVVLLDEHGKQMRSIEFAAWLEQKRATARRLVFIIGGPYGFSPRCLSASQPSDQPVDDDLLSSDDTHDLHRTDLSCMYHHQGRTLPS